MNDELVADALLKAARNFYGQGFKTDRAYWLALARAIIPIVQEYEREECAKVAEGVEADEDSMEGPLQIAGFDQGLSAAASAIRDRDYVTVNRLK